MNAEEISNQLRADFSLDSFYSHCAIACGVPVIGSSKVTPEALAEAAYVIEQMLKGRREVLTVLANNRGGVYVMAAGEMSSELPEFAPVQKPARANYDRRGRGYGNHIACSVGEENLLHFKGDP